MAGQQTSTGLLKLTNPETKPRLYRLVLWLTFVPVVMLVLFVCSQFALGSNLSSASIDTRSRLLASYRPWPYTVVHAIDATAILVEIGKGSEQIVHGGEFWPAATSLPGQPTLTPLTANTASSGAVHFAGTFSTPNPASHQSYPSHSATRTPTANLQPTLALIPPLDPTHTTLPSQTSVAPTPTLLSSNTPRPVFTSIPTATAKPNTHPHPSDTPTLTWTPMPSYTPIPSNTALPPSDTPMPTYTPIPPSNTPLPTSTAVPPTSTPFPPTNTLAPTNTSAAPTDTPIPVDPPTDTPIPPTKTPRNHQVKPILENLVINADGTCTATWGYDNDAGDGIDFPIGSKNSFKPSPDDRGQPTTFSTGRHTNVVSISMDGKASLTWHLDGYSEKADCP